MKTQYLYTLIFIIPIIFILGIWGYFSYTSGKLNPKYDFVYATTSDLLYNATIQTKLTINSNGNVEVTNCPSNFSDNSVINTFPSDCVSGNIASYSFFRYTPSNKKQTSINYETLKNTKFVTTKISPDGYSFKGDRFVSVNANDSGGFFIFPQNDYRNSVIINEKGEGLIVRTEGEPFNRVFIGWVEM